MKHTSFILLLLLISFLSYGKKFTLLSPDKQLELTVSADDRISYYIKHGQDTLLYPSIISMKLEGQTWGENSQLKKTERNSVSTTISTPFYKRSFINDRYNELILHFKDNFDLIFRAYDEGIAYRFVDRGSKDFIVINEEAYFNFGYDSQAFIPYVRSDAETYEEQFFNSFENCYSHHKLNQWNEKKLAFSPLVIERLHGRKVVIAESDLMNYPGMFLYNPHQTTVLKGMFAGYPARECQHEHVVQTKVVEREPYIARCKAGQAFPWRIVIVADNDMELADNDMVYKLASPSRISDTSWIKPGKVAWEWWNACNLYGVNFRTGINNRTYEYYIDFASENKIEYVLLDDGWSVYKTNDLFDVVPEIDLKHLTDYAASKNVGIILWAGYNGFNKDMERVCKHYSELGIKGFKIDFMDRDDQKMVDFHVKAAETAARYKLLIDFHGTYKPTGLQRTYPNVLNFEAVHGLEQLKFPTQADQVTYDVTFPFIRQIAGPSDYTQGAMRNATKENFRAVFTEPMSQGTRCRQLASYIVFDAPLSMLCDSPSRYKAEQECTDFISSVPTIWDNTLILAGEIGNYIATARKKDDTWYVGALTNWDKRTLELDLSFLGEGDFIAEVFKDGINADKAAIDYTKEIIQLSAEQKFSITMQPGGGCALKITKLKKN